MNVMDEGKRSFEIMFETVCDETREKLARNEIPEHVKQGHLLLAWQNSRIFEAEEARRKEEKKEKVRRAKKLKASRKKQRIAALKKDVGVSEEVQLAQKGMDKKLKPPNKGHIAAVKKDGGVATKEVSEEAQLAQKGMDKKLKSSSKRHIAAVKKGGGATNLSSLGKGNPAVKFVVDTYNEAGDGTTDEVVVSAEKLVSQKINRVTITSDEVKLDLATTSSPKIFSQDKKVSVPQCSCGCC